MFQRHTQMEKHIYFGHPPPENSTWNRAASTEMLKRLVGIYWISSVPKCEMKRIVNQPQGTQGEEGLSIIAALQSSHSQSLWNSSLLYDISDILEQGPQDLGKGEVGFQLSFPHSTQLNFIQSKGFKHTTAV